MPFNSSLYIFLFLPCVAVVYFLLNRLRFVSVATIWLVLVSLFFYSYLHVSYLFIFISSVLVNYGFGAVLHHIRQMSSNERRNRIIRGAVLSTGVFFNLCLLGYYKYADFFLANINPFLTNTIPLPHLTLPMAISFFTFQQIAYLVDCSRENVQENNFINYLLFVSFFPKLIVGPIVRHHEIMPQFSRIRNKIFSWSNAALGIFFFSIGLFKKVWIADQFSTWADKGFDSGINLTFFDAWGASLCYTYQLYFDFSGYTDMAIGSALFFNIVLPVNFNSPYKAVNIQEFWRRWHMTLSRWLRDYLYIPLGGNRKGWRRSMINLLVTFVLAGLWHGAGWTFILWGGMHGVALVVHRLWSHSALRIPRLFSWLMTIIFVNFAWVIFRSHTMVDGIRMLKGMIGQNGFLISSEFMTRLQNIAIFSWFPDNLSKDSLIFPEQMYWYLLLFGIVLILFPNTCQIGGLIKSKCDNFEKRQQSPKSPKTISLAIIHSFSCFRPNLFWAILTSTLFSMAIYYLFKAVPKEFIYFNF